MILEFEQWLMERMHFKELSRLVAWLTFLMTKWLVQCYFFFRYSALPRDYVIDATRKAKRSSSSLRALLLWVVILVPFSFHFSCQSREEGKCLNTAYRACGSNCEHCKTTMPRLSWTTSTVVHIDFTVLLFVFLIIWSTTMSTQGTVFLFCRYILVGLQSANFQCVA